MATETEDYNSWQYRMSHPSWWVYMLIVPAAYLTYCTLHWTGVI
ncbi:hypothetical protein [Hymenobacter busanensis]|nr:hypothetical protein [Hymenobacter busanensis]